MSKTSSEIHKRAKSKVVIHILDGTENTSSQNLDVQQMAQTLATDPDYLSKVTQEILDPTKDTDKVYAEIYVIDASDIEVPVRYKATREMMLKDYSREAFRKEILNNEKLFKISSPTSSRSKQPTVVSTVTDHSQTKTAPTEITHSLSHPVDQKTAIILDSAAQNNSNITKLFINSFRE